MSKFRRLADSHGVDEIIAVATSATREAENGSDFLKKIAEDTGIRARVISGTEEAKLIHRAAAYGVGLTSDVAVVVDIGGGRLEFTGGEGPAMETGKSFAGRHPTDRTVRQERSAVAADARKLNRFIDDEVGKYPTDRQAGIRPRHRVPGTIQSIGAVAVADRASSTNLAPPITAKQLTARKQTRAICRNG
jgi:exopolyphosphatase/pppGpp-phosphohydrolase